MTYCQLLTPSRVSFSPPGLIRLRTKRLVTRYMALTVHLYSITSFSQEVSLRLWDVEVTGLHCGPEAAAWLSKYLGGGCLLIQHAQVC